MPFWINCQRNAPTGSTHTPTPGPAPKRTQGPSTPNFYDTSSANQGTNSNCDGARFRNAKVRENNAKISNRRTYSKLTGAADRHVIDMNRHILKRQGDWTRHLRRSQGYRHLYQGKMLGQDDQKLSFRSG
ncbi:hypothetical protein HBH70_090810 [Parastagonospora nodorum]|nr:hypothetical protein HBI06_118590 [Parastagonospora nodorum]KAH4246974.1 hypothetical protein HBI05_038970 [Parastagonospora nodorum]KAH5139785.1 hypothetical protein HBH70_090810 [Parastagonospora nodorum]KAH5422300.1 hypothetical protein HBI46_074700 [Parastagonospora nodorum]